MRIGTRIAVLLVGLSAGIAPALPAGADHDYGGGYYEEDRYGSEDRNRNRNRNRGAFSPGPFDDSPVDAFNGNVICLPGSTCYTDDRRRDEPPPEQGEPA